MKKLYLFLICVGLFANNFLFAQSKKEYKAITLDDGSVEVYTKDNTPELNYASLLIKKSNPIPEWRHIIQNQIVDNYYFTEQEGLIVSTLSFDWTNNIPFHSNIYMFDLHDHQLLWDHQRDKNKEGIFRIINTEPVIIDMYENKWNVVYYGIDPVTGKMIWENKISTPQTSSYSSNSKCLYVAQVNRNSINLASIDIYSGSTKWEKEYKINNPKKDHSASIKIFFDKLILSNSCNLIALNLDGLEIWRQVYPEISTIQPISSITSERDSKIIIRREDFIQLLDLSNGKVIWSNPAINIKTKFCFEHKNLIIAYQEGIVNKVIALRSDSGKMIWELETENKVCSSFLPVNEHDIIFTTKEAIVSIDCSTGNTNKVIKFPEKYKESYDFSFVLPDILSLDSATIHIARERKGLISYTSDLDSLRFMHLHNYGSDEYDPYAKYISSSNFWSIEYSYESMIEKDRKKDKEIKKQLVQYFDEYQDVIKTAFINNEQISSTQVIPQAFQLTVSYLTQHYILEVPNPDFRSDLMSFISSFADAIEYEDILEERKCSQLQLDNAISIHSKTFNGNYYIRPFLSVGKGLTIIDLKTGKRKDLLFSPKYIYDEDIIDIPNYIISNDHKRLLTSGIEFDSASLNRYVHDNTLTIYPSVLEFNLSDLEFDSKINDIEIVKAAEEDNLTKVRELVNSGIDVDSRDSDGSTPLIEAINNCNIELAKYLLEQNADPNRRDLYGAPLHYSLIRPCNNREELVKILLAFGADFSIENHWGDSPVELCQLIDKSLIEVFREFGGFEPEINDIQDAYNYGHDDLINKYTSEILNENTKFPEEYYRLILYFASKGNLPKVKQLISKGVPVNYQLEESGSSALHEAAYYNQMEVLTYLLKQGIKIDVVNNNGYTPLVHAARKGNVEVLNNLIDNGSNVNKKVDDLSPLMYAVLNENEECVFALLQAGSKVDYKDRWGTSLGTAVRDDNYNIAQMLIEADANVNEKYIDEPLLMRSVSNNSFRLAKLLIENGANLEDKGSNNNTALAEAALNENIELVKLLVDSGAKVSKTKVFGEYPIIDWADRRDNEQITQILKSSRH